jgi:hypothetical protein
MPSKKDAPRLSGIVPDESCAITRETRKVPPDLSEAYNEFVKVQKNIVDQAASILNKEIEAGIVFATTVEERYMDVDKLRHGDPDDAKLQMRESFHDVLDIFIDLAFSTIDHASEFSRNMIKIRAGKSKSKVMDKGSLPMITMPDSIKPGGSAIIPISLENTSSTPTEEFSIYCTDLVDPKGNRMSYGCMTFEPPTLSIKAYTSEMVTVDLIVPEGTPEGDYSCLVRATKLDQLQSVFVVKIRT